MWDWINRSFLKWKEKKKKGKVHFSSLYLNTVISSECLCSLKFIPWNLIVNVMLMEGRAFDKLMKVKPSTMRLLLL
jgi:hypothetical protein